MVGFDVPHVTNDMIMRFMDVDVSLLPGMISQWSSRIGDDERTMIHVGDAGEAGGIPLIKGGNTDWEAWYNAVFAFLVLGILVSIVGLYFYFRSKPVSYRSRIALKQRGRHRRSHDRDEGDTAERMPLGSERLELDDIERAEGYEFDDRDGEGYGGKGKGKGKELADDREEIMFALGDDDEDERH